MYSTIFGNIGNVLMRLFDLFPIKKKIVFRSFYGEYYSDNPKYLYEEMKKIDSSYDYVWLMNDDRIHITGARVIKNGTVRALYEMATAKCWIDNARKREWCVKRKNQYYVQTWHAGIGLKAAEKAVEKELISQYGQKYIDSAKNDSKMADLFLANSDWMISDYKKNYWYEGKILKIGLPREDILFSNHSEFHKKICDYYKVPHKTKFVLYAPTFRAEGNLDVYNIDFNKFINSLQESTDMEWKIIVRLHPNIKREQTKITYNEYVLNGSEYSDVNELILASQYLISDYSSCLFDGMIAGDKVIIYASDIAKYSKERGFLFKFDELPFPVCTDTTELIECILNFNEEYYNNSVDKFMKKLGIVGGNATHDIAEYIFKEIQ